MRFSSLCRFLKPASVRARRRLPARRARPRLEALEDRCLLSAGIALTPDQPAPQLVGQPITWTATAPDASAGAVYQFSVGSPGGPFRVVRDFNPDDQFTWAPMQEGNYRIKVAVKDGQGAQDTESAVVTDKVDSRVTGDAPVISPTSNPLVALFSAPPGPKGTVHVEFAVAGDNPSWQSTNELPSDPARSTNFFVAGMLPNTTYEMRDVFSDGTTSDPQLFTTGALPSNLAFPTYTVQQPPGPGSDLAQGMIFQQFPNSPSNTPNPLATDLSGNVVWYYDVAQAGLTHTYVGQSLVPGGTVLVLGVDRYAPLPATLDVLREIDLAGNTVRETNIDAVNAQLTARGDHPIFSFTHDVQRLPNGDTAVIAPTERTVTINGTPTEYVGMTIVVLDKDFQVSWAWDSFDHLDVNRGPILGEVLQPGGTDQLTASTPVLPAVDWLHANAVSWSPEDENLVVSLRAQDWVIKIDYANGAGDGHIIWRLGQGGDFAVNSTDPSPWFSHQHDAHYIDDDTLILFDNGNTRRASDPTADSRGQVWKLDEKTMTATLVLNVDMGSYSPMFGAAQRLSNGDYSFLSGGQGTAAKQRGQTIEVRPDGSTAYVLADNKWVYRSFRVRTLYQGVSDQLTVTSAADSGPGSLRSEIALAQGGDTIEFDPSLAGQTITLTGGELVIAKSLDIKGPGADHLTVSGNKAGRVFDITAAGADVTIRGLTIADGLAAQGAGIENVAGNLTLSHVTLSGDQAVGAAGQDAEGGGVFNGSAATLHVHASVFADDVARGGAGLGGASAGSGYGGALFNQGIATLSGSTFSGNEAIGGSSTGLGGSGFGGGITNDVGGSLTVLDGSFLGNQALGGVHGKALPPGNPFSVGDGAAIDNDATLVVRGSAFVGNQTHGGAGLAGIAGGNGGAGAIKSGSEDDDPPAAASITDSCFLDNQAIGGAGGAGAPGAQAACGAFLADHGVNFLSGCTFLGNEAVGGAGGAGANGGAGRAGALRLGPRDGSVSVLVTGCLFAGNEAIGGAAGSGGVGGVAEGGAIGNIQITANDYTSSLTIRDSVLRDNEAVGGAGVVGGAAHGGGLASAGGPTLTVGGITTTVANSLVFDNVAQGADGSAGNGGNGQGGGVFTDAHAVLTLLGSTIVANEADGGSGAVGFSDGKGQGGGAYVAAGGSACEDDATLIVRNLASTSDDNVFGALVPC